MNELLKSKYKYYLVLENLEKAALGQIFWAGNNFNKKNQTSHCFVVVAFPDSNQPYLYGAMLTSSTNQKYNNVPLKKEYFKELYNDFEKFEFPTEETLFVPRKYIKFNEWAPFYLVGELTEAGNEVIKNVIGDLDPEIYLRNKNVETELKKIHQHT